MFYKITYAYQELPSHGDIIRTSRVLIIEAPDPLKAQIIFTTLRAVEGNSSFDRRLEDIINIEKII
jgi:hypothetical protein